MRYHLSLGSNAGDRRAHLDAALRALEALEGVAVTAVSHGYETEPMGDVDQPPFVNIAVEVETDYGPLKLIEAVKRIEADLGREPSVRWGPRTIDIDIVLCGDQVIETERLTVPHKGFRNRAFVLVPLAEIAPGAVDPVTGETVAELAAQPGLKGRVVKRLT